MTTPRRAVLLDRNEPMTLTYAAVQMRPWREAVWDGAVMAILWVTVSALVLGVFVPPVVTTCGGATGLRQTRYNVMGSLLGAVELYGNHVGRYPTTAEGLGVLVNCPSDPVAAARWRGPYVTDAGQFDDPWGTRISYRLQPAGCDPAYELRSCGPDADLGTTDDITN